MAKHVRRTYKTILRKKNTFLKPPSSETDLLERGLVMHGLLSLILSRIKQTILVDAIIITNGVVFVLWLLSGISTSLQTFLEKYFVLQYNFQNKRTNVFSMIGHGFSHMDYKHLAANMAALNIFSEYAISTLGPFSFIQLFSGGLIASALTSCLWPNLAGYFGLEKSELECAVGASGAISAIITFVCLTYREYVIPIDTPNWLKIFLPQEKIEVSFEEAGIIWFVSDIFGLFYLNQYFDDDETMEKNKNIDYSGHVGGSLFGLFFFGLHFLLQRHGSFLRSIVSTVSPLGISILTQVAALYFVFVILPDKYLQNELQRRQMSHHHRR